MLNVLKRGTHPLNMFFWLILMFEVINMNMVLSRWFLDIKLLD